MLITATFTAVTLIPHSPNAIAVGWYSGTNNTGDVVEEWNGSTWKQMKSPPLGATAGRGLSDVFAASAQTTAAPKVADLQSVSAAGSAVWVVGYIAGPFDSGFAMRLEGSKWVAVKVAAKDVELDSVVTLANSTAWVGGCSLCSAASAPFIEHFTGDKGIFAKLDMHIGGASMSGMAAT